MPTKNEPHQPITLAKTNIIEIDGQSVDVPVNVMFQLFPYPRVVIESERLPNIVLQKERFNISLRNGAQLDTMCLSRDLSTGGGSLIPARQPVDVLDKGIPLRSVQFSILNFPVFYGTQARYIDDEFHSTRTPHTTLEASDWCIEITEVPNTGDFVRTLKRDRGYGITYNGIITRTDGADFSSEKVETLLEALRMFLSFVRGNYCSLALVEGKDQDEKPSWVRWGAHYVESWNSRQSWFRWMRGGDILSELFPEFFTLFESRNEWKETITRAVDWYVQSNESATHVGIILTQVALERLAYQVLGRARKEGRERTGEFIAKALRQSNLDPNIPQSCKELLKFPNWAHGPHAIVEVRNDLVHPKANLGNISQYVHHEAWNLGQWYIEMILLNILGYQGKYINRLSGWDERDQAIQRVPWAQECKES